MKSVGRAVAMLGLLFGLMCFGAATLFHALFPGQPDAAEIRDLMYLISFELAVVPMCLSRLFSGFADSMQSRRVVARPPANNDATGVVA